ncbi:MAG: Zn-dependent alcohol dehydrogenase [Candidatus Nealsonbacteria bacterium]|nr:MAG: Zn-dependent alcohol dehydrogenase [Candidatus Nealsonbacteria bacterium]
MEEVLTPEINENEILIKVKACNICGTDIKILKYGYHKIKEGEHRILGHEITGEVIKKGKNLSVFNLGDRVAVAPNIGCGHCYLCAAGYNNLCNDYEAFGVSVDGGFAEYMKVTNKSIIGGNIIKIPENLSFLEASITEPFSCVYNAYESLKTCPSDNVLIIGAGAMGLLHLILSKIAGAKKVIVSDISDDRLKLAKKYGADVTLNPSKVNLKDEIFIYTGGKGADVIVTACSVPSIQEKALDLAAKLGRINFFGGLPEGKDSIMFKSNIVHYRQLKITGTTGSTISQFIKSMEILENKKFDIRGLITHTFSLEEIEDAFGKAISGEGSKISIVP